MSRDAAGICRWLAAMSVIFAAGCGLRPEPSPVESSRPAQGPESKASPEDSGEAVASGQKIVIGFSGRVDWIEPLGERDLSLIPVHFDPGYALAVRVDSVDQQKTPVQAGKTVIFAIHSPSKLFAEDAETVVGRTFAFQVVWQTGPSARFSGLAVVPESASPPD